jgi:hypothetical protein
MSPPPRLTIRLRLTLLYSATFATATAAALGAVYLWMDRHLTPAVAPTPAVPTGTSAVPSYPTPAVPPGYSTT